ncbi:MAG: tyrosine--tRNA ligase [Candidatus Gastranaerophilales bacterium]|nr:tyrosine--tRNA ligase [Candidatus Gastranaerophilales bacterium]
MEDVKIEEKFLKQALEISKGAEVLPNGVSELAKLLQNSYYSKKPLRVKLGLDPTRPDLHLGHTVVMRKLKKFQELGHTIVLIVGGATAMVGDPSGKSETRPALSKEQVEENAKTYFEQMSKVLDVTKAEVRNNADWLHSMKFTDFLKLASATTVAKLMTRDDFAKRYAEGRPISPVEFFYPLMQGYDSVEVDADIEFGGTDQRFNLLMGRDIQAFYGLDKAQIAFMLPLIEGTDGVVKMSKTYPEHCISLTESPKDMYGKLMSIPDELMEKYFTLLTDIEFNKDNNPRDEKMRLAYEITKMYNGADEADKAQNEFINVVRNKGVPDDIPEFKITGSNNIVDILVELNFAQSKGEAKRLISGGGVKFEGEKISDIQAVIEKEGVLQGGKRKYAKIIP